MKPDTAKPLNILRPLGHTKFQTINHKTRRRAIRKPEGLGGVCSFPILTIPFRLWLGVCKGFIERHNEGERMRQLWEVANFVAVCGSSCASVNFARPLRCCVWSYATTQSVDWMARPATLGSDLLRSVSEVTCGAGAGNAIAGGFSFGCADVQTARLRFFGPARMIS